VHPRTSMRLRRDMRLCRPRARPAHSGTNPETCFDRQANRASPLGPAETTCGITVTWRERLTIRIDRRGHLNRLFTLNLKNCGCRAQGSGRSPSTVKQASVAQGANPAPAPLWPTNGRGHEDWVSVAREGGAAPGARNGARGRTSLRPIGRRMARQPHHRVGPERGSAASARQRRRLSFETAPAQPRRGFRRPTATAPHPRLRPLQRPARA
jgi:hypothetical protein